MLHQMTLERFARVGHHLGRKRRDFVGLSRQCAELLAPIGRLQLHDLGEIPSARQARGQVAAGIQVAAGDVDDFTVERCCAPPRRIEGFFKSRYRCFESSLRAVLGLARLAHGLLGSGSQGLGNGGVES